MSIHNIELHVSGTRVEIRNQVIMKFLLEEPGTGTGDGCSKYIYNVETLLNGNKVFLRRPAMLNKGMDFTVHVENMKFREKRMIDMPSHENIMNDLIQKKNSDLTEYEKVKVIINKLYKCQIVKDSEYRNILFNIGFSTEAILKSTKWLFIEQDVTYWNWSGRDKLYSFLKENNLC